MPNAQRQSWRSSRTPPGSRRSLLAAGSLALSMLSGCGGVTQFSDTTPLSIRGPAPVVVAPPPEPAKPKRVEVKATAIEIKEKIQFELDEADIKSESHELLNEIYEVLRDNPQIKKVDIVGHTDGVGAEKYNQDLSERRAKAVLTYLVQKGIDASRLTSQGKGKSQPIADNDTAAGKEKNRRVEFLIVAQEGAK